MVYFATGDMKLKLIIMYFMHEVGFELTQDQIYYAMVQNGWMEFFDFQNAFAELEEDEYVGATARAFGKAYSLTAKGNEAVDLFYETLPDSMRRAMTAYARENEADLQCQNQFSTRITNLPSGGQQVRLRALDKNAVLLEISFRVPDGTAAKAACENWPNAAIDLYQEILNKLLIKE